MKNRTNLQSGRLLPLCLNLLAFFAGYSKAMQKYRTNKAIEQISQIVNGIRTLYGGQKNYSGISTKVLQKAKLLPESAFDGNSSDSDTEVYASHSFGGHIHIYPAGRRSVGDQKAFSLSLMDIPEDACIEILTQDWGDSSGFIAIGHGYYENGFDYTNSYEGQCTSSSSFQCAKDGSIPMEKALTMCATIASISGYAILMKFY